MFLSIYFTVPGAEDVSAPCLRNRSYFLSEFPLMLGVITLKVTSVCQNNSGKLILSKQLEKFATKEKRITF